MKNKKMLAFFFACTLFSMACSFAHPVTPTLIVERGLDSSVFGTALAAMQNHYFPVLSLLGTALQLHAHP